MTNTRARVPRSIQCRICSEPCKRGVSLPCCSTISCRACATKSITTTRTCWSCGQATNTQALVNDEQLRQNVERFNKGEWVPSEQEETNQNCDNGDLAPPAKKFRGEEEDNCETEAGLTLQMMMERNSEFDQFLLPQERECKQLRVGALLELIFQFSEMGATCLLCEEWLSGEEEISQHLIDCHPREFSNLKVVLRYDNESTIQWISKAIQSEFLYQTEKIFPIEVN